jgi:hypothetical protein
MTKKKVNAVKGAHFTASFEVSRLVLHNYLTAEGIAYNWTDIQKSMKKAIDGEISSIKSYLVRELWQLDDLDFPQGKDFLDSYDEMFSGLRVRDAFSLERINYCVDIYNVVSAVAYFREMRKALAARLAYKKANPDRKEEIKEENDKEKLNELVKKYGIKKNGVYSYTAP